MHPAPVATAPKQHRLVYYSTSTPQTQQKQVACANLVGEWSCDAKVCGICASGCAQRALAGMPSARLGSVLGVPVRIKYGGKPVSAAAETLI